MWNWNYIIFFIFCAPRGPALVNTTSPPDRQLVKKNFPAIIELLEEIKSNHRALLDIYQSCPASQPQSNGLGAAGINSTLPQMAQAIFKILQGRYDTFKTTTKCSEIDEFRPGPRSACTPFEQHQLVNEQLKKVMMLNCTRPGQPNVIVPMPSGDEGTTGGQSPLDPNSKRTSVGTINIINNLNANLNITSSG